MKTRAEKLLAEFENEYPYVTVGLSVAQDYIDEVGNGSVHLFYDYVLSRGLAEDVEE